MGSAPGDHRGRATPARWPGRLYAISTAGSLLGTMLSALVLIPFAGTQRTFIAFALALSVVAAIGLGRRFALVPVAPRRRPGAAGRDRSRRPTTGKVLYEGETEQQYVRVDRAARRRARARAERGAGDAFALPARALSDGRLLGRASSSLPFASLRAAAAAGSRSSATPPGRSRAPTAASIPRTYVDGGRARLRS